MITKNELRIITELGYKVEFTYGEYGDTDNYHVGHIVRVYKEIENKEDVFNPTKILVDERCLENWSVTSFLDEIIKSHEHWGGRWQKLFDKVCHVKKNFNTIVEEVLGEDYMTYTFVNKKDKEYKVKQLIDKFEEIIEEMYMNS